MSEFNDYLTKSRYSLQGAESEFTQARFDNAVNRAYYACFQAAIAALLAADVSVQTAGSGVTSHQNVHRYFAGFLIQRRKLYPSHLRNVLQDQQFPQLTNFPPKKERKVLFSPFLVS
jgi:uncharacterized protein (UPF0332 family)